MEVEVEVEVEVDEEKEKDQNKKKEKNQNSFIRKFFQYSRFAQNLYHAKLMFCLSPICRSYSKPSGVPGESQLVLTGLVRYVMCYVMRYVIQKMVISRKLLDI